MTAFGTLVHKCSLLLFLLSLSITCFAQDQSATLRGFVTDASDGQVLQGVNVTLIGTTGALLGTVTDGDGIFILTRIPPARYRLRVSYIGYETYTDTLDLAPGSTRTLTPSITPSEAALGELVVEGERSSGAARVTAGLQSVQAKDIEHIPSPDVSGDLVTYLTAMPGVVSTGDRGGQLFVRGGEPSHNLTLLDGMQVYQPFHMLGFYSAFPADVMQKADIYAGGFGSRYAGRIASVIDVQTRNGNKKAFARTLSFAPFVNAGILEGPLIKDRVSFLASARASTIERFAARFIDEPLPYSFGDFFGKVHILMSETHQVSLSGIHTYDRGALDPVRTASTDEIRWQNTAVGLRYLILPGSMPVRGEVLASVSYLDTEFGPAQEPTRTSRIGGFNAEVNITNFSGRSRVDWGFFIRSPSLEAELGGLFQNLTFSFDRSTQVGAYLEPDLYIGGGLRLRAGVLGQLIGNNGIFFEPRLRLVWDLGMHEWSAAGGLYNQNLIGLNDRRDATNVFTAWAESPNTNLPRAVHALLGYRLSPGAGFELSVEGFYKDLSNLFISEWTPFPRFTTRLQQATGRALGIDLRAEVRRRNLYAFVNYGLSSVEYDAQQPALAVWFGTAQVTFRPPHDRRHQLNALISTHYKGFDLSARWHFGAGLPYNQVRGFDAFLLLDRPVDLTTTPVEARVIYDTPYGGVLPTYHRLDFSVERRFVRESGSTVTLQAGLINAYNRTNLFALDLFTLRRVNQLPLIPTLGLKFEF